jgi:sec-independent protein translocase protein TatB
MFDIGWGEFLVIGIVALIVIGPKELPGVIRTIGQAMSKLRRMASEFQGQFQEAMREAEMSELKKQVDEMTDTARGFSNFDPLESVRKDMDGLMESGGVKTSPPATPTTTDLVPMEGQNLPAPTVSPGSAEPKVADAPAPKPAAEGRA